MHRRRPLRPPTVQRTTRPPRSRASRLLVALATLSLPFALAACQQQDREAADDLDQLEDTLAEDSAALESRRRTDFPVAEPTDTPPRAGPPPAVGPDTSGAADEADAREAQEAGLPPFTVGVSASNGDRPGPPEIPTVRSVRTARHAGAAGSPAYERLVVEFDQALPAWSAEYVDTPLRECGSGRQIHPPGDAWLQLRMEHARGHTQAGQATVQPEQALPGLEGGLRLIRTCDFEGIVTLVLALRSPEPYRVFELRDPPRLVVDVRAPGG